MTTKQLATELFEMPIDMTDFYTMTFEPFDNSFKFQGEKSNEKFIKYGKLAISIIVDANNFTQMTFNHNGMSIRIVLT